MSTQRGHTATVAGCATRLWPPKSGSRKALVIKELCAELDGFTLHAAVRIQARETSRLEPLCRYITRPPLSGARLSLTKEGVVVHQLRAPYRDGTTHFVFDPLAFIERLATLIPPPRMHTLSYHGVLAPGSSWRSEIVSRRVQRRRSSCGGSAGADRPRHRYSWPELMLRVFSVDVQRCGTCGSRRRSIAVITQPEVVAKILEHAGLESVAPMTTAARPPPQMELGFEGY